MHTSTKQHASVIVPVARVKRTITGSLGDVWSCPPLLKCTWVVPRGWYCKQQSSKAAKQGDAELLGAVLGGRKQQAQQHSTQQQPQLLQRQQPDEPQVQQQQQRQQKQQWILSASCADMVDRVLHFHSSLKGHWGVVLRELGFPRVLRNQPCRRGCPGACVWLTAVAAEEAVRSNNTQLLVQMVKEGWFYQPWAERESGGPILHSELLYTYSRSVCSVKQQLGPAFLAAAAAGDVEAGKVLLSYCPDLLDYVLWNSPAIIQASVIDVPYYWGVPVDFETREQPFLEVLLFVSQLHMAGFRGLKLEEKVAKLIVAMCRQDQRHKQGLVQMLLELGVVTSQHVVKYTRTDSRTHWGIGYFEEVECHIIAVAVAEQNAGAVAVLVAAGAVLHCPTNPFTMMILKMTFRQWPTYPLTMMIFR